MSHLPAPEPLRQLVFDIETAPMLAHLWSPKQQWVGSEMVLHEPFLLSWAAKWYGQKRVYSDALRGDEALQQNDGRLVEGLAALVRQADIVIAHNGDRFDIPRVRGRCVDLGLEPLGPVNSIDTLKLCRRSFGWQYNDLNTVAVKLLQDHKVSTGGFRLWKAAYAGDDKALVKMERYNRKDVVLLERVFDAIKSHVDRLPALYQAGYIGQMACPTCGSGAMIRRGYRRTKAAMYARFQCKDCLRYSRGRNSDNALKLKRFPNESRRLRTANVRGTVATVYRTCSGGREMAERAYGLSPVANSDGGRRPDFYGDCRHCHIGPRGWMI